LQTDAFHKLNLKDLISSESLAEIPIYLGNSNAIVLEARSLYDSVKKESLLSPSKQEIDSLLLSLLNVAPQNESLHHIIGGAFINNYPINSQVAQINCDCFRCEVHPDYIFSILADGCSWGISSQLAARCAVAAAARFINSILAHTSQPVKTAENLAWVLIQAMAHAHEAIVTGHKDLINVGTTTLNISLLFTTPDKKKYLMVAGVGDCKVFIGTQTATTGYGVTEVVCSKRTGSCIKDPGGRLGPFVGLNYNDPDLRNLAVTCMQLPEGESIILNMSDGVHDNLHPKQLGKEPYEVEKTLDSSIRWSSLSLEMREALAMRFQSELLASLINQAIDQMQQPDLDAICGFITHYCHQVTACGRNFMEENPSKPEPKDKKSNPGKMDHCSLVAFKG
jgi:hypothetical protein